MNKCNHTAFIICANKHNGVSELYKISVEISLTHVVGRVILELQTEVVGINIGVITWKKDSKILIRKSGTK